MAKSVKGTQTEKNLLTSFAGESQARMRYTYFASVAKKEGYEQIAAIFTETADQEKEHAKRMFKWLEGGMVEITASPRILKNREKNTSGVAAEKQPKRYANIKVMQIPLALALPSASASRNPVADARKPKIRQATRRFSPVTS